jgi:hypothetical protein
MEHEVLAVRKRVLGAEHPDTLSNAGDLAASPAGQGSIDDIQGGSISYAPEKPGIRNASSKVEVEGGGGGWGEEETARLVHCRRKRISDAR